MPMPEELQKAIRSCIRAYMKSQNISAEELAVKMNYKNPQAIHNYLSSKALSEKTVQKFAQALEYPYDLLIRGEFYPGPGAFMDLANRVRALEETIQRIQQALSGSLDIQA